MRDAKNNEIKVIKELESIAKQISKKIPRIVEKKPMTDRPIFIEFSGTPKAGKTMIATRLELFFKRNGFKVRVLQERASTCPIRRKDHMFFNVWTACITLAQILETLDGDEQVVIIDRGIFDALCWFHWFEKTGKLTEEERKKIYEFFLLDRWLQLIDIVFLMTTTPISALSREIKDSVTRKTGSIMNKTVLKQFNESLDKVYSSLRERFKCILRVDTTNLEPARGIERVTRMALQTLQKFLSEKIMVIERETLEKAGFYNGFIADPVKVSNILKIITRESKFVERTEAEKNSNFIQPIPCGVLKYQDKVFFLRRSEEDANNRLHNKYTIWAGGHVREEDLKGELSLLQNALYRELNEELYIRTSFNLTPLGLILDSSNPRSKIHLAIVYLINVDKPDIAIALNQKEFKERKGKSLSGRFLSLQEIVRHTAETEFWSKILLENYFHVSMDIEESGQRLLFPDVFF